MADMEMSQSSYLLLARMELTLPFLEVKLIYKLLVHHKSPLLGVVKVFLQVVKLWWDSINSGLFFYSSPLGFPLK